MDISRKSDALSLLKESLSGGKTCSLEILNSFSMYPLFEEDKAVEIAGAVIKDICFGDIVVYKGGACLIAHRCIRILESGKGKAVVVKGDNSALADSCLVSDSNLVGKIVSFNIGRKKIDCGAHFWRIASLILTSISLLEAGYSSLVFRLRPGGALYIKRGLMFFGRILRQIRGWLLKIMVCWIKVCSLC
jgi:signal peptidase I